MSQGDTEADEVMPLLEPLNVVVLGASAGGVEALSRLIAHLPAKPDFAVVVLTHLDPNQESLLPDVLQRQTRLPVHTITSAKAVQHGELYVLAPGQIATLRARTLQTAPRAPGLNLPIDEFVLSVVRDDDACLAVVILSGTGNDGTAGALETKAAGGYVIAQDPASAAHQGMPLAVIDEKVADEVLPPEEIGSVLERFFSADQSTEDNSEGAAIPTALSLIQKHAGIDLSYYKEVNIRRRLVRRAFLQTRGDLGAYLKLLRSDTGEVAALRDDLLIGVTSFFRDSEFTAALERYVLPDLIQRNADPIRIWVPACSTGEEAYSIAMQLHDTLKTAGLTRKVQIFGSDVSATAIQYARLGRYQAASIATVPESLRSRYFTQEDNNWRISKEIREMCIFAAHNVFTSAPFSNVDLVSVRNLLIYLRKAAKRHAFEVFFYALRRGGHLLLAPSEAADPELFEEFQPSLNLYRRRQATRPPIRGFSFSEITPAAPARGESASTSLESLVDRLALARYAPAGFVVDANGRVVQFRGDTSHLLQPTSGDATLSLAKLVRSELQVDVRAALMEAVRSKVPIRRERVRLGDGLCTMEVVPVPAGGTERYFLVSIQDCAPDSAPASAATTPDGRTEDLERYVRVLGDELEQTRGQLKHIVTEYDATSEELRTANEEVLSTNEELQSANEELKEAKRELEFANAHLTSLNQELQQRNQLLTALNDDLGNLIRGIPVPVLLLDRSKCVRHLSPAAAELFNLKEGSLGQPLGISDTFHPEILEDLLNEALRELRPVEREIQDRTGRWYMLSTRAYQTSDNRIEGAVLALQDIHGLKVSLEAAQVARTEAERANAAKNDFLALVSHELRSPLNVISNWVQLFKVLGLGKSDKRISGGLDTIDRNCREQGRLIDELLDISRITSGNFVLDLRPTDFAAVIRATVEGMVPQAGTKQIEISTSGLGDSLMLAGDTRRLQQLVGNILGNAIKFTPDAGHIEVSLSRVEAMAELTISDSGIGISGDELPRIFQRFSQSDISKTRKFGGIGLGLAIARSLAEAHGGNIAAVSEGVGKGARFIVRLPLTPTDVSYVPDTGSSEPPSAVALLDYRILVVDDERSGRQAFAQVLTALGAEVSMAGSAAEAISILEHQRFDALISDIAMPEVDGYQFMREVRAIEARHSLRPMFTVALTGFTSAGERDEALAAGFDAHFGKPPNIAEVAARIVAGVKSIDATKGNR